MRIPLIIAELYTSSERGTQSREERHHLIIRHRIKFSVSHFATAADAIHDEKIIVHVHDFLTFFVRLLFIIFFHSGSAF